MVTIFMAIFMSWRIFWPKKKRPPTRDGVETSSPFQNSASVNPKWPTILTGAILRPEKYPPWLYLLPLQHIPGKKSFIRRIAPIFSGCQLQKWSIITLGLKILKGHENCSQIPGENLFCLKKSGKKQTTKLLNLKISTSESLIYFLQPLLLSTPEVVYFQ